MSTTETETDRLDRIEAKLDTLIGRLDQAVEAIGPVLADPAKLLMKLMRPKG